LWAKMTFALNLKNSSVIGATFSIPNS